MALIETNKLNETWTETRTKDDHILSISMPAKTVICKSPWKLKALLEKISPGFTTHYVSDGDWSMHDLVLELLELYGPAALYFSTYALRETPVRKLILAMQDKKLITVKMLVDDRARIRTPEVFQMAKMNFCEIYQTSVHAKVCVLKTASGCISIVGSANWTTNPKIECGVVSFSDEVGQFHISWIQNVIAGAKIFK